MQILRFIYFLQYILNYSGPHVGTFFQKKSDDDEMMMIYIYIKSY